MKRKEQGTGFGSIAAADRYHKCEQPIRRLPPHELAEIFLLEETRKARHGFRDLLKEGAP